MRIEQLEYLAAVVDHGSLRRASEQLHVSQSALSTAVRSLERELGVSLLERHRSGARASQEGRDLLPLMTEILVGVAQLKAAAADQTQASLTIRVGTVHAGTSALLVPAVRQFGAAHRTTTVDVATMLQSEIHDRLIEGRLELGLINLIPGDDIPGTLVATTLLRGRPAVCLRTDDPLAAKDRITVDDLRARPFVSSRPGYLMHRLAQRLFGPAQPAETFSADGAEMAKLLVANGAGPSVLPDYSIAGDPLEQAGIITSRPLVGDLPSVSMLLVRRQFDRLPLAIADFEKTIVELARAHPQSHVRSAA
ncbi:LysR family transcriptional regulator [Aeromicrobium endophyticum]|uniref:LysR family transcriptional regulator n=1 Tax=Aeromicrobium endophyticum TaxID=2292704 RepID=A0A371P4U0_9ACTN|nr:LysR family transcriptional regulator [Aeromicrobium endophyticum]REK70974.1 LysR family transcriptional regulator [Aeromicrobium endophyticum]